MENGENMMFLDSSFIISLLGSKETNHQKAKRIYEKYVSLEQFKVINGVVLAETLNQSRKCQLKPYKIYSALEQDTTIICVKKEDYKYALDLNRYYNNSINFKDCLILKSMIDHNITKIISFDTDFDKIAGIERIF